MPILPCGSGDARSAGSEFGEEASLPASPSTMTAARSHFRHNPKTRQRGPRDWLGSVARSASPPPLPNRPYPRPAGARLFVHCRWGAGRPYLGTALSETSRPRAAMNKQTRAGRSRVRPVRQGRRGRTPATEPSQSRGPRCRLLQVMAEVASRPPSLSMARREEKPPRRIPDPALLASPDPHGRMGIAEARAALPDDPLAKRHGSDELDFRTVITAMHRQQESDQQRRARSRNNTGATTTRAWRALGVVRRRRLTVHGAPDPDAPQP